MRSRIERQRLIRSKAGSSQRFRKGPWWDSRYEARIRQWRALHQDLSVSIAMPEEQWLRTPQAAIACGVSEKTLKRLRGDVLEEGVHYQAGFSSNSAFLWEVNGVRAKLAWRGMIQRRAAEVIREELQEVGG